MKLLSSPNTKLRQTMKFNNCFIYSFNLPAYKSGNKIICIGAQDCIQYCYAQNGHYLYSTNQDKYLYNYLESKKNTFEGLMIKIITDLSNRHTKPVYIRLHSSGDFYHKDYVNKWAYIAACLPNVFFYGYTKSYPLLKDHSIMKLDNVFIRYSFGSKYDELINVNKDYHSKIFNSAKEMRNEQYMCASFDDLNCIKPYTKIGLLLH